MKECSDRSMRALDFHLTDLIDNWWDNMENFEEKQLSSELVFDGRVLHVYKDTVSLPNGKTSTREVARHDGAVCVVPLTDDGEVVCVRQYRYAHGRMFLEIPAGKLDGKGEDRREAALRELREETGITCEKLTSLGDFYTSAAILDEVITMYLAEGLTFGATEFDEDEFLIIDKIPLSDMVDMIMRGEIVDSKTQAAILKVWILKNEIR